MFHISVDNQFISDAFNGSIAEQENVEDVNFSFNCLMKMVKSILLFP